MKSGEPQPGKQDQTNKSSKSRKRRLPKKEAVSVPSKVAKLIAPFPRVFRGKNNIILASQPDSMDIMSVESFVKLAIGKSSNQQLQDNAEILRLLVKHLIQYFTCERTGSKEAFFERYEKRRFRSPFNDTFLNKKEVEEAFSRGHLSWKPKHKKREITIFIREIKSLLLSMVTDEGTAELVETRAANQPAQRASTLSHSLASQPSQRTSGGLKTTMAEGRVDRSQSGRLSMLLPRTQAPACISQIPAWSSSGVLGFAPWIHPGFPTLPVGQRGIPIPMFWGSGLPYQVGVPCFLPAPQRGGLPYQVGVPSFMPVPQMSFVQGRGATRMPQGSALPYQAGVPRLMPVPQMGLAQGGVPTRMPQASVSPVSSVRANNAEHTARKSSKQSAVSSHSIFSASGASANRKEISSTKHHSPNASP